MDRNKGHLGRRSFVSRLSAAAAAVAGALTLARGSRAAALGAGAGGAASPGRAAAPEGDATLAGLRPGDAIERWTISAIYPPRLGGVAVVLRTAHGAPFQVDVLRKDGGRSAVAGVASSRDLSVHLSNRGDGQKATDEEQGLGAMALAGALRAAEARGASIPRLLTHRERSERYPLGAYKVRL